jgi:hypothetical protein
MSVGDEGEVKTEEQTTSRGAEDFIEGLAEKNTALKRCPGAFTPGHSFELLVCFNKKPASGFREVPCHSGGAPFAISYALRFLLRRYQVQGHCYRKVIGLFRSRTKVKPLNS